MARVGYGGPELFQEYVHLIHVMSVPTMTATSAVFKDLTGLRADCTSLEGNEAVQRALMTLIEVKRYQSKDKELIDALPQVIAQTIIA